MDSWNKHVPQISFQQCVTFCEHQQLKGWPPRCSSHMGAQSVYCNKSSRPQLRDQTLCFSAWDRFFASAATKGWAWYNNAELVNTAFRFLTVLVASGFPKEMAGMHSLDKHVKQISFPQCITCCEHGQPKGWPPHFQPTVAQSWISTILHWLAAVAYIRQPRSQSISCSPNLGYHNSSFCKHDAADATIMQSWRSELPLSGASSFW